DGQWLAVLDVDGGAGLHGMLPSGLGALCPLGLSVSERAAASGAAKIRQPSSPAAPRSTHVDRPDHSWPHREQRTRPDALARAPDERHLRDGAAAGFAG